MNFVEQIKYSVKISDVVRKYCRIVRLNGRKCTIQCPFHRDKTPSLSLDDDKNMFYCFGCKAGGDVIKFVQLIDKLSFVEACKKIGGWYGIDYTHNKKQNYDLDVLGQIIDWSANQLQQNKTALEYLKSRGISNQTIEEFKIGWLGSLQEINKFCSTQSIEKDILSKIGMKHVNLLENRIIFPIYEYGKPVGFGGRALDKERAKYVNTSGSDYFHKRSILYGLNTIKPNCTEVMLVEGYIDVCIAKQYGIPAVSCLGTAASVDHLKRLLQICDNIIIAFDGDLAGRKASSKLALGALSCIIPGKTIRFINMPNDEDPASFLVKGGKLEQLVQVYLIDMIWDEFKPRNHSSIEKQVAIYQNLLQQAKSINDYDLRSAYIEEWRQRWSQKVKPLRSNKTNDLKNTYELILLGILFYNPNLIDYIYDYLINMTVSDQMKYFYEHLIRGVDFIDAKVLEYFVELCPLEKLYTLAPFTKDGEPIDLAARWLEVYKFYIEFSSK